MLTKKQVCELKSCIKKHKVPIYIPYTMYSLLAYSRGKEPKYLMAMAEYTKAEVKLLSPYYLEMRYYLKVAKELGFLDDKYRKTKVWNRLHSNRLVDSKR